VKFPGENECTLDVHNIDERKFSINFLFAMTKKEILNAGIIECCSPMKEGVLTKNFGNAKMCSINECYINEVRVKKLQSAGSSLYRSYMEAIPLPPLHTTGLVAKRWLIVLRAR
jgi:hypothetical protein